MTRTEIEVRPREAGTWAVPPEVARRFEAVVFDWDGTAVTDREADATEVRTLVESLSAAAVDVFIVSGTHVGNIHGQLGARPPGPGRLYLCLNRGSERRSEEHTSELQSPC